MEHKKAVAATLAAMISATGAATEASFEDPADLLQNNKPDPHVEYIGAAADDVTDDDDSAQDEEKQRVQKSFPPEQSCQRTQVIIYHTDQKDPAPSSTGRVFLRVSTLTAPRTGSVPHTGLPAGSRS